MKVKVRIPTPLRRLTKGKEVVDVESATINDAIQSLEKDYPGIKARLCDEKGELHRFVNIYVNGEDVRFLQGVKTSLKQGDEVSIVPAVAGG
ncbi:MAG: ubiquitin-like small modifier protein 1 [Dehalococcoidia bacterium]|nr:ubiquitin-like small modifier protein 1 [Dehalococcoidia bacterium]